MGRNAPTQSPRSRHTVVQKPRNAFSKIPTPHHLVDINKMMPRPPPHHDFPPMTATSTRSSATKKSTKNALVPRLRFPEFEGEWEPIKLSKLAKINPRKITLNDDVEITFVPMAAVSDTGQLLVPERRVYGEVKRGFTYFIENDILIAKITPCFENGKRFLARNLFNKHGVGSTEFHVIRPGSKSNNQFVFYYLNLGHINSKGRDSMSGSGGQQRVPANFYTHLTIPVPSLPEQQKIADCLSSLDDLITAEAEKLETLKVHKKGLMQELFPREGETTPRIRFPEFEGSGEWEVKRLGNLTSRIGSGKTPRGGKTNYRTSGRPFVRSQNVDWGTLVLDDIAFIDDETHSTFVSTEIRTNDVLLNITGASIGRNAIADSRIAGGNVNQHVCIIRTKETKLLPSLLSQYLLTDLAQRQIDDFQAGGNRQGLNFGQIRSFAIPVPPQLPEQQKIASALSSLDDRITAQAERIETLKAHKKGLMQQLFPVMEG